MPPVIVDPDRPLATLQLQPFEVCFEFHNQSLSLVNRQRLCHYLV